MGGVQWSVCIFLANKAETWMIAWPIPLFKLSPSNLNFGFHADNIDKTTFDLLNSVSTDNLMQYVMWLYVFPFILLSNRLHLYSFSSNTE